jgi:hypothetical protein
MLSFPVDNSLIQKMMVIIRRAVSVAERLLKRAQMQGARRRGD